MLVVIKYSNGSIGCVHSEQIKIINNKCYAPSGICSMAMCEILYYEAE